MDINVITLKHIMCVWTNSYWPKNTKCLFCQIHYGPNTCLVCFVQNMLVQTKIMLDFTQTFGQNKKCIRYKGPHKTKAPKPQHLSVQYVILANNIFTKCHNDRTSYTTKTFWQERYSQKHETCVLTKRFDPKHKIHVFGNNVIVKTHISCFWVYGWLSKHTIRVFW